MFRVSPSTCALVTHFPQSGRLYVQYELHEYLGSMWIIATTLLTKRRSCLSCSYYFHLISARIRHCSAYDGFEKASSNALDPKYAYTSRSIGTNIILALAGGTGARQTQHCRKPQQAEFVVQAALHEQRRYIMKQYVHRHKVQSDLNYSTLGWQVRPR
jgi:hypothetical protein